MMSKNDESFGAVLRQARLNAKIGLRELAAFIGKSPGYLSDIEQDKVRPPSEAIILAIAKSLDVDQNILLCAAKKVDPELSEYVSKEPGAADFLRMAKDKGFEGDDWDRITLIAEQAKLGKGEEKE